MNLEQIRNKIDDVDDKLIKLFYERMELSVKVAQYKKDNNLSVANKSREREIITRLTKDAGDLEMYVRILYSTIFDLSRSYQTSLISKTDALTEKIVSAANNTQKLFPKKAVIACQGVEGAYSQLAGEKLFPMANVMYFKNFDSVFSAVDKGLCKYGILPIENSSHGSVGEVYDLMLKYNFHIVRSIKLCVSHELLAKPGTKMEDITEIVSHEQGIGQCSKFLSTLKNVKITTCPNTALAAEYVAKSNSNTVASISSHNCAQLYGLTTINRDIQDSDNNYTRFICISKDLEIYPGANRISLMISLSHEPGSLYELLAKFAALGLNLTKLESRPVVGKDFEFMFYFDFEASVLEPQVISLLSEISRTNDTFVFLGNYSEV